MGVRRNTAIGMARTFDHRVAAVQVASHAQKFFLREALPPSRRDKKRASIHDIREACPPDTPPDARHRLKLDLQHCNEADGAGIAGGGGMQASASPTTMLSPPGATPAGGVGAARASAEVAALHGLTPLWHAGSMEELARRGTLEGVWPPHVRPLSRPPRPQGAGSSVGSDQSAVLASMGGVATTASPFFEDDRCCFAPGSVDGIGERPRVAGLDSAGFIRAASDGGIARFASGGGMEQGRSHSSAPRRFEGVRDSGGTLDVELRELASLIESTSEPNPMWSRRVAAPGRPPTAPSSGGRPTRPYTHEPTDWRCSSPAGQQRAAYGGGTPGSGFAYGSPSSGVHSGGNGSSAMTAYSTGLPVSERTTSTVMQPSQDMALWGTGGSVGSTRAYSSAMPPRPPQPRPLCMTYAQLEADMARSASMSHLRGAPVSDGWQHAPQRHSAHCPPASAPAPGAVPQQQPSLPAHLLMDQRRVGVDNVAFLASKALELGMTSADFPMLDGAEGDDALMGFSGHL